MKQTFFTFRNLSATDKSKAIVVLVFMGVLLIILGFLVGMLLRPRQFQFSLPTLPVQAAATSLIPVTAPTQFVQTEDCRFSALLLGTTTLQVQDLPGGTDGTLAVPADTTGIAYRLEGTGNNTVFLLSPTPQNIAVMSTISIGSAATMKGSDCAPATYSLSAPQAGALNGSVLASQPEETITIFFPTASSSTGFTFRGRRVTEPVALNPPTAAVESTAISPAAENTTAPIGISTAQSTASPTAEKIVPTATSAIPTPDYGEILAEIGLVDTSLSLFRTSLKIEVSIYNFGKIPISLSDRDISLTQPDGTVLAFKSSKPGMPYEIQPGETKKIELNFETPSSPTATLRV
ncbi:MAG TPA: hypothetical protein VK909_19975, partial [Anaerolineales bacterium]|nr:hypothetical protein [Anaerolineales bacterium]